MASSTTKVNSLKRKAADGPPNITPKRVMSSPGRPKANSIRLFDLPAELRNLVYEKVGETQIARVRSPKVFLTDGSGLLDIDDQLRREYLPILLLNAVKIQVKVFSFNFGSLITFLNRLSNAEINALPSAANRNIREVEVLLHSYGRTGKNERDLKRWLNRAGHTTKKGTMLNTSYKLRVPSMLGPGWDGVLNAYIENSANKKGKDEARKIKGATVDRSSW